MTSRLSTNLDLTLKGVAVSMLIAVGVEFLTADRLLLAPVVVANIYFVLSIIAKAHARRIAVIAFGLACVVPIDAIRTFVVGEASVITLIVTVVASVYLAGVSYQVFRQEASALLDRARRQNSSADDTDTTGQ
ncbi:MAG: hypothetical protein O7G86_09585 [Gammaproteobacteria bacterium]|nr:hypothetical protein [Gammaproteobacteria bacterium]MCZ6854157.1 hypothetical protein [Gammaproteobacteria bacterium]